MAPTLSDFLTALTRSRELIDEALREADSPARRAPLLANVRPSGKHLMEDFYYAGGVPAVLRELLPMLDGNALSVNG